MLFLAFNLLYPKLLNWLYPPDDIAHNSEMQSHVANGVRQRVFLDIYYPQQLLINDDGNIVASYHFIGIPKGQEPKCHFSIDPGSLQLRQTDNEDDLSYIVSAPTEGTRRLRYRLRCAGDGWLDVDTFGSIRVLARDAKVDYTVPALTSVAAIVGPVVGIVVAEVLRRRTKRVTR